MPTPTAASRRAIKNRLVARGHAPPASAAEPGPPALAGRSGVGWAAAAQRLRRHRLRASGGRDRPGRVRRPALVRRLDRRAGRRRLRLGPDGLGGGALPPPLRRGDPLAGPLQPADRGALHDRPGDHRRGAVLPHGGDRAGPRRHAGARPRHPGDGREVVVDVHLLRRGSRRRRAGLRRRIPVRADRALAARRRDRCSSTSRSADVIHAFWMPGVQLQAGRGAGPREHVHGDPDPRGRLPGPLLRAVRPLPLPDALHRAHRAARRVRRPSAGPAGGRQRRGARAAQQSRPRSPARKSRRKQNSDRHRRPSHTDVAAAAAPHARAARRPDPEHDRPQGDRQPLLRHVVRCSSSPPERWRC